MGAYIYRLKGKRHYTEMPINGSMEKVYDLVYWYKPYYSFWDEKEPRWMKPVRMLEARLEKMFRDVDVRYVRVVYEDLTTKQLMRDNRIMEWNLPKGRVSVYDEPDWNGMRVFSL
jgi:hypothetical protein